MSIINFMDEHIYNLAYKLYESLVNNESVTSLNALEKRLNDSFEVYNLSNEKDKCLEEYLRLKDSLGEKDKKTILSLKKLQDAKEKLINFPLVKEYLTSYTKVRDLYMEVDNILFSDFRKDKKCR